MTGDDRNVARRGKRIAGLATQNRRPNRSGSFAFGAVTIKLYARHPGLP